MIEYIKVNFNILINSLVSAEVKIVVTKSPLILDVVAALDVVLVLDLIAVLDIIAVLDVVVVGSVWILEVGVTVTITVVKVVVTVIVKLEQEELLVKGDGTGDEVIIFDVINEGEDKGYRDDGGRDDREGEGDFEDNDDKVVGGERYVGDWEGNGEGEFDVQLLSGSKRFNESI